MIKIIHILILIVRIVNIFLTLLIVLIVIIYKTVLTVIIRLLCMGLLTVIIVLNVIIVKTYQINNICILINNLLNKNSLIKY